MGDASGMPEPSSIAIIGGGPAGLRAAEVAAQRGAAVDLYDAMPSVGRKFLVAGKSGLNLTNDEPFEGFLARYSGGAFPADAWRKMLERFDNEALCKWAAELGVETFVSAGGKVLPTSMKAAPLLRAWVTRLRELGVRFHMRHRWLGFEGEHGLRFEAGDGERTVHASATVLALGGASWPQTGSTGHWVDILNEQGITVNALQPANVGWEVAWPAELLAEAEGAPLKNIAVSYRGQSSLGELVITKHGLEGAPLYRLGSRLRETAKPEVTIDFKPSHTVREVEDRLGYVQRNFVREARRRLKLCAATAALLKFLPDRGPWKRAAELAREIKACRIPLVCPRPIEEAISSAGGVAWSELNEGLMLAKRPGVFVAGEMLDWEAPTGGYLLQGCFATGTHVGEAAASAALGE